jgi:hypothetical protein
MKHVLRTAVLSVFVLQAAIACATQANDQKSANPEAKVLLDFNERVKAYVDLRKKADDGAPPLEQTEDSAKIRIAQTALAERIMAARAGAKRGEIFTPEITQRFRRLLRPEVKDADTKRLIEDDNPGSLKFKVNGPYPDGEPLSTVPPNVLASLPQLPEDLEYRFLGKHMILRDSRANIVVDYIPNAIA